MEGGFHRILIRLLEKNSLILTPQPPPSTECLVYFFFLLVIFFLSYQARDSDSFNYSDNIKNTFERNTPAFHNVSLCRGEGVRGIGGVSRV